MLDTTKKPMGEFQRRIETLQAEYDARLTDNLNDVLDDGENASESLSHIAGEIHATILAAAACEPTDGPEALVLLRMALSNLGIDEEGGTPGHVGLRGVIRFLQTATGRHAKKVS